MMFNFDIFRELQKCLKAANFAKKGVYLITFTGFKNNPLSKKEIIFGLIQKFITM